MDTLLPATNSTGPANPLSVLTAASGASSSAVIPPSGISMVTSPVPPLPERPFPRARELTPPAPVAEMTSASPSSVSKTLSPASSTMSPRSPFTLVTTVAGASLSAEIEAPANIDPVTAPSAIRSETSPAVPPPANPSPATTAVMSPPPAAPPTADIVMPSSPSEMETLLPACRLTVPLRPLMLCTAAPGAILEAVTEASFRCVDVMVDAAMAELSIAPGVTSPATADR